MSDINDVRNTIYTCYDKSGNEIYDTSDDGIDDIIDEDDEENEDYKIDFGFDDPFVLHAFLDKVISDNISNNVW